MRIEVVAIHGDQVLHRVIHLQEDEDIINGINRHFKYPVKIASIKLCKEIYEVYDKTDEFVASVEGYGLTGYEQDEQYRLYWSRKE